MKLIKKISIMTIAFVMLFSLVSLLTLNSLQVSAAETIAGVTYEYKTEVIHSSIEELGIPSELGFYFYYEDENLNFPFTLNGLTYTEDSSGNVIATPTEDVATIKTIGIPYSAANQYIPQSAFFDIDFSQFTSCKNLVLEGTLNTYLCEKVSAMPALENIFVLNDGTPPLYLTNTSLKNVVMTYGIGNMEADNWYSNSNYKLSSYNENVKFVTIEGYFPLYKAYMNSYRENENYTTDFDLKIYTIPNDECPIPEDRRIGETYVEYGGGYYMQTRTRTDTKFLYSLIDVDDQITKIVIDSSAFTNFRGVFASPDQEFLCVYVLGDVDGLDLIKSQTMVQEIPTTFTYSNYANVDTVMFVITDYSPISISITADSIGETDEVTTKFYYPKSMTIENTSTNTEIEDAFLRYDSTSQTPKVEIVDGDYSFETTELTMTVKELKAELTKLSNPTETPGDDTSNEDNSSTDDTNNDNKLPSLDEVTDDIKESVDEFKEELKESKSLQAVTAVLTIVLSVGLFYVIYVVVKKIIKWFQKR